METIILYVPAFAFFFLLSLIVAGLYRWRLSRRGFPYFHNIIVSFSLLTMWALLTGVAVDVAFVTFALFVVFAGSWCVRHAVPFVMGIWDEAGEREASSEEAVMQEVGYTAPYGTDQGRTVSPL